MPPALALERIECTFNSRDDSSDRYTAVRDTTLRVAEGEFVSVVGPTGCGKTTLLNVAAGLLQPSAGAVTVFGTQLAESIRSWLHVPKRSAHALAERHRERDGRTGVSRHGARGSIRQGR